METSPPPPNPSRQQHAVALQLALEQDYPVAQLDSWPLTSRAPYKQSFAAHQTPPLYQGERTPTGSDPGFSMTQILRVSRSPALGDSTDLGLSSPISPRQRKALQRHSLLDESKNKPLLLQELEAFVSSELAELAQQQQETLDLEQREQRQCGASGSSSDSVTRSASAERLQSSTRVGLQRLQVFRLVFQRVIAAFSVYAPVLAQVQHEYERVISQLRAQSLQIPKLHAQLQTLQSHCVQEIATHNLETKLRSQALKQQLKSTQGRLTALAAQNAALKEQQAALQLQVEVLGRRGAEMQLSNHSLVNGIKRHDDTLRHIHERSREEGMALAQMASKYHHACDEIAELKRTIATLEEKVGGVHVAADKATIALLTHDLQDAHTKLQAALQSSSAAAVDELQTALARQSVLGSAFVRVLGTQGVAISVPELLAVADRSQAAPACGDRDSSRVGGADFEGDVGAPLETQALIDAVATWVLEKLGTAAPPKAAASGEVSSAAARTTFLTETEEIQSLDTAARMVSTTELLVGRGFGADVPEFLQFDGVVRNLRYPRRKLEHILARVWQHKDDLEKVKRSHATSSTSAVAGSAAAIAVSSSAQPQTVPLTKVLSLMLNRTSASRADALESAYNIFAALERFASHSSECRLFLEILRGEIPEDARQDQLREVYVVHDALAALEKDRMASDSNVGDPALPGRVPLADVIQLLRKVFPWKVECAFSELHRALLLDQRGNAQVDYAVLLLQSQPQPQPQPQLHDAKRTGATNRGGGGGRSHFAECLRAQYIDDLLAYRRHLQTHVERQLLGAELETSAPSEPVGATTSSAGAALDPLRPISGAMVAIRVLRDLLQECDVAKPVQEINRLLATASGLSLEQVLTQDALMVNARQFVRKLPTLLVKPSGKFQRPTSL
ncbi:hypothetical protein PybrP1_001207 [[Pythium] brassicae (nom. inval.)]|nr:hypothetical protein PybrP1_001207 [[Pythium] brassicae (nom. inval.)]